jgi:dienelactone hydrolase
MIYYASVHAFTDPEAGMTTQKTAYNAKADKRSWERMEF